MYCCLGREWRKRLSASARTIALNRQAMFHRSLWLMISKGHLCLALQVAIQIFSASLSIVVIDTWSIYTTASNLWHLDKHSARIEAPPMNYDRFQINH